MSPTGDTGCFHGRRACANGAPVRAFVAGGVARIESGAYLNDPCFRRIRAMPGSGKGAPRTTLTREDWTPTP